MSDFLLWFITKHWLIASFMFPEMTLIWAVWMKYTLWACTISSVLVAIKLVPGVAGLVAWWRNR